MWATTRSRLALLVEKEGNGNFQANRLTPAGAATSLRRARGGGLYVVAFRNRGHDSRHRARPVNLSSIVYAGRFYRAGRSCTPITVPTTSTADFRTTRTAGVRGCSRPGGSRGATRPGRSRRLAWSTWRHRVGRPHRRYGYVGLDRLQRSSGSNRTHRRDGLRGICGSSRAPGRKRRHGKRGADRAHRRYGCHRVCGTARTTWHCGRDGHDGSNRAAGHRRI